MKTIHLSILTLLLAGFTFTVFSQERRDDFVDNHTDLLALEQSDFEGWEFNGELDYSLTRFTSTTYFFGAKFNSTADFHEAKFDSITYFSNAEFASTVWFSAAKFDSTAYFMNVTFESTVYFPGAMFAIASFTGTTFESIANFEEASFKSTVYFSGVEFKSTASFEEATFESNADFQFAQFDSIALFRKARFPGKINFGRATLPSYLDFSLVTEINDKIDLTRADVNPKYKVCHINLIDADISKFRFKFKNFKLWFPEPDSIESYDKRVKADFELKSGIYEDLLNNQKENGFNQSYEILDKEYREFKYTDPESQYGKSKTWQLWGQTLNWLDKNWWGYGYEKELIIRNVFLIFLILSFINSFFLKYLIAQVYANEKIENLLTLRKNKNWFFKWIDSLRYSIFYTAVIFFSFNFDMEKLNYADNLGGWKIFNLTYFMIIYLGGVVCMAYLANFIITV